MIKTSLIFPSILWVFTMLCSCVTDNHDQIVEESDYNKPLANLAIDEVELVMIPTPVQTPTILVHSKCNYNPSHIEFADLVGKSTTSSQKAISLGISIVDFTYAGVNKDHILAKEKLANCMGLMDDLGIDIPKDEEFLIRIEENLENNDSLSYYVLSAFERSTQYFRNTDKEELGISILVGTALESSLLLTQDLNPELNSVYFNFFSQQKQYAKGLEVIMRRFKGLESMKRNIEIAEKLRGAFEKYEDWATSADSALRFQESKDNLIAEITEVKENCYH